MSTPVAESQAHLQSIPHKRGCLFRLGRGLLIAFVLWLALNLLGIVYQQAAEASDKQAYPPPGQLVDIGGFSLHIHCMGEGSPTVILEAGTGGSSLDWSLVHPDIAESTRVCAYDRQGYAWSDDGTHPRTSQQVATDLHTLLNNANIEGPYVLVGHSIGAIHAQAFINLYPDEVAGLVTVDRPPVEYYLAQGLTNEEIVATELSPGSLNWAHLLNLVGVFRLSNFPPSPAARDLPAEFQSVYAASVFQSRYYASLMNEYATIGSNYLYATELPPFSSELPFVMLASDPNAVTDPLAQTYYEARVAFASRWPNARFVAAEGSSHFIHVQRPELVIQSIQDVVEAVRTGEPLTR